MDERVRFVARLLDGEKMAALCREFAISRKTDSLFQMLSLPDIESAARLALKNVQVKGHG